MGMKGSKRQATPDIDLHGLHLHIAEQKLEDEMHKFISNGIKSVRIIHGHGKGVIKLLVDEWIANHQHLVTDYQTSHDGGATAIRL
jgi:DNA-nicking Smr family endonuclease